MYIEQITNMAKIAINKSILREYNSQSSERIVYLNNNDEFQIQLFNQQTYTVGAEISINGKKLEGLLVIKPGERIWLERPMMDNHHKFKFETYEVENGNSAVEKAIQNNGMIEIRFYKEKNNNVIISSYTYTSSRPTNVLYDGYGSICSATCEPQNCGSVINTLSNNVATNNAANSINAISSTLNLDYTFNADTLTVKGIDTNSNANIEFEPETKETGRIGSGSYSNQAFKQIDTNFETWPFHTESIHIMPMSQKPFTSSDLQKIYCTNCGRKINPKFKFCPYCGTKVEQCPNYCIETKIEQGPSYSCIE